MWQHETAFQKDCMILNNTEPATSIETKRTHFENRMKNLWEPYLLVMPVASG